MLPSAGPAMTEGPTKRRFDDEGTEGEVELTLKRKVTSAVRLSSICTEVRPRPALMSLSLVDCRSSAFYPSELPPRPPITPSVVRTPLPMTVPSYACPSLRR